MSPASVFDPTRCSLGEGPLWHPERGQLFWFDINAFRLYTRTGDGQSSWAFDAFVTAAGWVDRDRLLIAGETGLFLFDLNSGTAEPVCDLEADNPVTRSNDARADPMGGFWVGTMGKKAEPGAGAIYRYYRGELRRLFAPWTTPNAICFAPDGGHAYLADTPLGKVWRQALDAHGWPRGEPELYLDLPAASYRPDGAVVDSDGNFWCAHNGHAKVTVTAPDGREIRSVAIPARRTTCPAFGGDDLGTLFVTTATQMLDDPADADGATYAIAAGATGQAEHRVIL